MFAICIESSHEKGMGHLFRALNLIELLNSKEHEYVVCVNDDPVALSILRRQNIPIEIVSYGDETHDWENQIIEKYQIKWWINDRLDTEAFRGKRVKQRDVKLITLDDAGDGAAYADINILSLPRHNNGSAQGEKVLTGLEFLILNQEIKEYRRLRETTDNILVTLGGSDTYGSTIKVVKILKQLKKQATVLIGPSFQHHNQLEEINDGSFTVKEGVASLIREFAEYDMAITGGGITPFEANASGLPCIIVANEIFEIENAKFLENQGSSIFAGYHEEIDIDKFQMELDVRGMSQKGLDNIGLNGAENIYNEIIRL